MIRNFRDFVGAIEGDSPSSATWVFFIQIVNYPLSMLLLFKLRLTLLLFVSKCPAALVVVGVVACHDSTAATASPVPGVSHTSGVWPILSPGPGVVYNRHQDTHTLSHPSTQTCHTGQLITAFCFVINFKSSARSIASMWQLILARLATWAKLILNAAYSESWTPCWYN